MMIADQSSKQKKRRVHETERVDAPSNKFGNNEEDPPVRLRCYESIIQKAKRSDALSGPTLLNEKDGYRVAEASKKRRIEEVERNNGPSDVFLDNEDNNPAILCCQSTIGDEAFWPLIPSIPRPLRKGKKNERLRKLPESRQILKGLVFFYIPNSDVSPLRRRRITRACEYGAIWTRKWHPKITHIIADKDIPYTDVLRELKMDEIPDNVMVLNENWPPECIYRGYIVEHSNPIYHLNGDRSVQAPSVAKTQATMDNSKMMKARRKSREINTPERKDTRSPSPPVQTTSDRPSPTVSSTYEDRTLFASTLEEARKFSHLPIDSEDDQSFTAPADLNSGALQTDTMTSKKKENIPENEEPWQKNFACMKDASIDSENPNAFTIDILNQMAKYYETTRDQWRYLGYRRAIGTLKKQKHLICTSSEAQKLPYIGKGIADKIEEIVLTKRLQKLENTKLEPNDMVIQNFMKIYGAGYTQAVKWLQKGYKTIDELLVKADLTENQKIGIEHLEDFNTRIPRDEVTKLGNYVRQVVDSIDQSIETVTSGSYRRGAKDCGDIDIMLTKPKTSTTYVRNVVLDQLVPHLFKSKFLTAELVTMSRTDGSKWHGACQLPASLAATESEHRPWRRIDFLIVPHNEMGAALLYFTGNDIFNRSMRLLARKKGMRLNQRGLYKDVMRGRHQERLTDGTKIAGEKEKEIFHILGVPWKEPWERNV